MSLTFCPHRIIPREEQTFFCSLHHHGLLGHENNDLSSPERCAVTSQDNSILGWDTTSFAKGHAVNMGLYRLSSSGHGNLVSPRERRGDRHEVADRVISACKFTCLGP